MNLNRSERAALKWLHEHGGTGVFERSGMLVVSDGDWEHAMRKTWENLIAGGAIELKDKRLTITDEGRKLCATS